ncbi:MAG: carbamoyl-phosphate synthase large subunit, partial [Actinobacteria bacterium]|nr:carbamoyl-phosphate synthase large subunit [Actinomycetota bacterium]
MPIDPTIKSVLVIGSGPIVIGQACEFDYSGTQACRVLRAEGIRVILVNSNPATIMTDPEFADATYIEPITPEFIERIIMKEKPDAVLATLGGQTALNAAMGMHAAGILERHGVRLIGADVAAISRGENRELFRAIVEKVGGESARSIICHTMDDILAAASTLGFPCVIRPSFTMGGLGSGIAYDQETLEQIAGAGLRHSPTSEVLIEESIIGWKEFELEVMRDKVDNVVIVCSIENIDPMGVHTGDSVTVAPALTLTDVEYQKLRDLSIDIIREVGVDTGGCNIQYAVNPDNGRIIVIEMNPRVSRSSALASKATGFPIAKIATKLAIGYTLDEIKNDITQVTPASFEPTLDYIVVKAPRFAFEKFQDADARLTTTMKSVGEAMAIGRSFPEALMKVLRSLERKEAIFKFPANLESIDIDSLLIAIATPTEYRLQEVQTLLWAGIDAEKVYQICKIDRWYLKQIQEINEAARKISELGELSNDLLRFAKSFGFSDSQIGLLRNMSEDDVRKARQHFDLHPVYKTVDTCAAEFQAHTPYHYSSYEEESEVLPRVRPAVIILGSGPNRIGQGIEFDYSCVHASFTLREADFETIMINCNPETVSTDYDTSDRLYFEPLTLEDVLEVIHAESLAGPVLGVITQLGGQTPLGLAAGLKAAGVNILGTSPEAINLAEERGAFGELLLQRNLTAPEFGMAASQEEAILIAQRIGYPVLVRPSFVLGGRGMEIVYDDESLSSFISRATDITPDRPVLVDRFLDSAIELDVDALYDGHELFLGGIMEHIEEAGIHSGDSACVLPAMTITEAMRDEVRLATLSIAEGV